jgi:hypothetical protein
MLHRVASRLCDDVTSCGVLDQWLADFQFEYATAQQWWRRAWVRSVYIAAWLRVVGDVTLRSKGVSRLLAFQIAGVGITTVFFITVPFWDPMSSVEPARRPFLALLLVPQALMVGLSFGSSLGVVASMGRRAMTQANRLAVVAAALLCSTLILIALQWVLPVANQAFRVAYIQRPLQPGLAEMSLTELAVAAKRGKDADWPNLARRDLQARLTLSTAPIALTVFIVTVLGGVRFRRLLGVSLIAAYYLYLAYERPMIMPGDGELWVLCVGWAPTLALLASPFFRRHRLRAE